MSGTDIERSNKMDGIKVPHVDCVASGYEWICPKCGKLNKRIEYTSTDTCSAKKCLCDVNVDFPEHAMG